MLLDQADTVENEIRLDGSEGTDHVVEVQRVDVVANARPVDAGQRRNAAGRAPDRDPDVVGTAQIHPQPMAEHAGTTEDDYTHHA